MSAMQTLVAFGAIVYVWYSMRASSPIGNVHVQPETQHMDVKRYTHDGSQPLSHEEPGITRAEWPEVGALLPHV
jgi:hypothetical protein